MNESLKSRRFDALRATRTWLAVLSGALVTGFVSQVSAQVVEGDPIAWPDGTQSDCPLPRSTRVGQGLNLTGRYVVVPGSGADTWYPSRGSDGSLLFHVR
jgi:hypothetical protein